ncbi:Putative monooxygenase [Nocardioides dokdonensis FR1436]|uniref:Putative monooxygenase n=1 Tax=Nocardioides dokdonensis FR1436 TaxID=1300347 RepID=A0A1A9GHR2_9ACTN|nr:putative quinol monooxygenase [Nocardioides dokdonensis]ANH37784.1 Putative monooxygenase [Nocardioides dokdonensis FR1436]
MSENLHVVATIPTDPAQGDAVRAGLNELVAATRAEEGNVSYTCYESAAAPGTFVMVEEWASQEAMDAHMTTPHMAKVFDVLGPALAGDVAIHPLRPIG